MSAEKSLFTSSTFWSVVISMFLKLASAYFVVETDPAQVQSFATNTAALVSFGLSFLADFGAIRGRVKAKSKVRLFK